jgi:uncharacterized protein YoaH (UPF0181 family)
MPEDKITVFKVAPECVENNPLVFTSLHAAIEEIQNLVAYGEIGDSVVIVAEEMTQAEFDRLPEHQGW